MATVNFYYRGKTENGKLSIRLIHSRSIDYRITTKIPTFRKYWYKPNGAKRKLEDLSYLGVDAKTHKSFLENVKDEILIRFNNDLNNGVILSKEWFKNVIDEVVNITIDKDEIKNKQDELNRAEQERIETERDIYNKNLLTLALERSINIRYFNSKNQRNRCKQILNKVILFQEHRKKTFKTKDVNQGFIDDFAKFLIIDLQHEKMEYVKRLCSNLKRAVQYQKDTYPEEVELSKGFYSIKNTKQNTADKRRERDEIVITLSFDELDRIHQTEVPKRLLDAKKCILFGSETGQRVSDFHKLTPENIKNTGNFKYWKFWNEKTGADVIIPINNRIKKYIDCYGMPRTQFKSNDDVILNRQMKEVCELAEIDEIVQGRKQKMVVIKSKKEKRVVSGKYKKYELISVHSLRRSFATNYYTSKKLELAEIRQITGHSTDAQLLEYINQNENHLERTQRILNKMNKENKTPQLRVLKNVSNE